MDDVRHTARGESWVDAAAGTVSREAFVSDDVFRLELDRIFHRLWIFLAHDSEIPSPGDYVVRSMGSVPVLVVRGSDGELRVLLNSCRHRGTKLCRGEAGNARHFVCPYHGWSYALDGRLITTSYDGHLPPEMDKAGWGLVPVPRLETYRGLVFAAWDPGVPALSDYLGDIAWYLDTLFWRSPQGMEVLAPPHRWRVRANWKIGALNFIGDSQHVRTTHAGPITLDRVRSEKDGFYVTGGDSFQVVTDRGHGCTLTYLAPGMKEENYLTHPPALGAAYAETLGADQLAMLHHLRVFVGNVFPNFSFIESQVALGEKAVIVRQWQPLGGTEMEVLSWVLAEREADDGYKQRALRHGFHNFGAAGGVRAGRPGDLGLGDPGERQPDRATLPLQLPFEPSLRRSPCEQGRWPGTTYRPSNTEVAQFAFMRRWQAAMGSPTGHERRGARQGFGRCGVRRGAAFPPPRGRAARLPRLRGLARPADRDIRYVVTARVSRPAEQGPLDYAIVDEDADTLGLRVRQISDPKLTWAENPATLTRRFVSNLEVEDAGAPDHHVAHSNLLVYRQRGTAPDGDFYAGRRRDVLRRVDGSLRIADRLVRLDHNVLFDGIAQRHSLAAPGVA